MMNARQFVARETLRNGLEICIRAAHPDDCDRVIEAFHKLDSESIYLRFFGPKKSISEAELRAFREVDFATRVILLCTTLCDEREIVIGSAAYTRAQEGAAEVAVIVEEYYRKLGIARRLLQHLGNLATDAGIDTFGAEVLPYNKAMLVVFGRCGWPMAAKTVDGTVHVTLGLKSA